MHDDAGVLQIHALRKQVGREQQCHRLVRRDRPRMLRERRKACEKLITRDATTRDASIARREHADTRVATHGGIVRGDRCSRTR